MREKLNLLLVKHCAAIKNSVALLGQHLQGFGQGDTGSARALDDAVALAHQLKGSSGTAGFQDICAATTVLYDHLKDLNAGSCVRQREMQQTMALFERLDAAAGAADPRISTLYLVATEKAER